MSEVPLYARDEAVWDFFCVRQGGGVDTVSGLIASTHLDPASTRRAQPQGKLRVAT